MEILIVTVCVFTILDLGLFIATPMEFRQGKWWRFLPGGGIAVYIDYKWRRNGN